MCHANRSNTLFAIVLLLLSAGLLRADDALLKDGRRSTGVLTIAANGRLVFTPKGKTDPLSWDAVQQVDFANASCKPSPLTGVRRVLLSGGQSLTAELLGWDKDGLRIRPLGMDRRVIPAASILGVRHLPGMIPLVEEDFSDGLTAWKVEGKLTSQKRSLNLHLGGQTASYVPADPIEKGIVGVDFALPDSVAKGHWVIELELTGDHGPNSIRLSVLGDGRRYLVETAAASKERPPQTCKAGRHRAWMEFGPRKALLMLDGTVLWHEDENGSARRMRALRLACAESDGDDRAPFQVEEVSVASVEADPKHPCGPTDQDEVWLRSGDQLFGRLASADRREIDLETRGRRLKLPWAEVIGFYPRAGNPSPHSLEGEWVRVWLSTGRDSLCDELEGAVTKLDETHIVLRHPALGELSFDRSRLHRLRRLFFGQRIELDNGAHHLGDKERPVASIQPPRAGGQSLSRSFRLEAVPVTARFLVSVVQLKGAGDGIGPALERGELRTEIWVNDQRVDYLNRLVDRAQARPQRLSVTIPKKLLRTGENVLELRQTPEAGTERYENCGLSELLIETEP